jgi:hypothetical protein
MALLARKQRLLEQLKFIRHRVEAGAGKKSDLPQPHLLRVRDGCLEFLEPPKNISTKFSDDGSLAWS